MTRHIRVGHRAGLDLTAERYAIVLQRPDFPGDGAYLMLMSDEFSDLGRWLRELRDRGEGWVQVYWTRFPAGDGDAEEVEIDAG